nr:CSC1-like protein At1g69450 [Tanacetum cinerariifolium]
MLQGLTNLEQLEIYFPFLTSILTMKYVSQVITGYLPNLILQVSLKIVPPVMKVISSQQGYISVSEIERSACHKVIWFTVWNVFFANVLSASAFNLLFIFLEFKEIPSKLAVYVPAQRFDLDPNVRFNLSFNLPVIERDITSDDDVEFFIDCATNSITDEIPHLYIRPPIVEVRIIPGPVGILQKTLVRKKQTFRQVFLITY